MNRILIKNRLLRWVLIILTAFILLGVLFRISVTIRVPEVDTSCCDSLVRVVISEDLIVCSDSWLKKNEFGLWEMYLEGSDYEMGVKNGELASGLIHLQEEAFVTKLQEMVPSEKYMKFLRLVVVWMNRNLDRYVPVEYQREIMGVSMQASDSFNFIGPAYQRILTYHAAHDIGHALQNMNLVACTAFSVKGKLSKDGALLVGRNFDFSMGDEFAKNKIVVFCKPEHGNAFASITWGGMIGVVSGMNDKGLVITLNAAKSKIPGSAKTPASILARQILQYASTIEDAWAIASRTETFVAESYLISSAEDHRTIVIEKSPDGMALYAPEGDSLILTNHFQSEVFANSELTLKNKKEGASVYRWERTQELLSRVRDHDEFTFAGLLRDMNGLGDVPIGMGNEKAVNQLIAHHSVIFKPEELKMWVSTSPYQLGPYLCYDLNRVFNEPSTVSEKTYVEERTIGQDPLLTDGGFDIFMKYRDETARLKKRIETGQVEEIEERQMEEYLQLNPSFYYPYYIAGEVYRLQDKPGLAEEMYNRSLSLEIPREADRKMVIKARARLRK
jgi:isopenicillin-N N-acyltransferase-like protein